MALSQRALDLLLSAVRTKEIRDELKQAIEEAASIGTSELENNAVTSDKLDQSILKVADITISSSEVLAIFTTPKTLIAAPGAGLAIAVEAIYSTISFNTTAYAAGTGETLNIQYDSGPTVASLTEAFVESAASARAYVPATTSTVAPAVNTALVAKMSATNPTLGNSPIKIRVIYRIVPALL